MNEPKGTTVGDLVEYLLTLDQSKNIYFADNYWMTAGPVRGVKDSGEDAVPYGEGVKGYYWSV